MYHLRWGFGLRDTHHGGNISPDGLYYGKLLAAVPLPKSHGCIRGGGVSPDGIYYGKLLGTSKNSIGEKAAREFFVK